MGSMHLRQAGCSVLTLFALAACSPTSAPPSPSGNLRAVPAAHDMVAQVRAAGNANDALDVQPLRDPQVEDLRVRASRLEAAGDYASGPNHVLPTSGAARIRGGLSTADFVKVISVQELTREGLAKLAPAITTLARAEGLEAHARSVEVRLAN